jgi:tetratricopeptide (TPR) repeat protein/TolB-like protein
LNHPNILDIHDIGTEGNTIYLVHELLEGTTLRDALKNGALPVDQALDYAMQIASGLAAAHEKGIVHRDLKPSNVFVTSDGRVKILDFGLAKVTRTAEVDGDAPTPDTQPGITVGTPGYMSPEQIRDAVIDRRTDIFSFGAVLYEMLSGRRAFKGDSSLEVVSNTLVAHPPELELPLLLSESIRKCLAKEAEARFQSCGDLLFMLNLVGRRNNRNLREVPGITRIAVLLVETSSGSERHADLCVSATDALIVELVRLPNVRVISTASVEECRRRNLSLGAMSDALGADLIVQISVGYSAPEVRFTVVLCDPQGNVLWTEQLCGSDDDFITAQRAMCAAVRGHIWTRLRIRAELEAPPVVRVERQAHDYYVKGLHHWRKHTAIGWATAAEWFKRSIAVDPSFAPAFSGLAHTTYSFAALQGTVPMGDYLTIKDATARALALDSNLADAHAIDARVKWTPEWNIAGADAAFRRSLTLNPSSPELNTWYAVYLVAVGRREEGLRHAEAAAHYDPVSVAAEVRLAVVQYSAGRYEDAIKILTNILDLEPGLSAAQAFLGCAYAAVGQAAKGVDLLRSAAADKNPVVMSELVWGYTQLGRVAEAELVFEQLLRKREQDSLSPICLAWCCASLGRRDAAFEWLQHAVRERCLEVVGLNTEPMFESIRTDPRFAAIVSAIGLPSQ